MTRAEAGENVRQANNAFYEGRGTPYEVETAWAILEDICTRERYEPELPREWA